MKNYSLLLTLIIMLVCTQTALNQELSTGTIDEQTEQKITELKKQLSEAEKEKGKNHPDLITILLNITTTYEEQGGYIPALPFALRGLEISEKVHGEDSLETAIMLNLVGILYYSQADNTRAIEYIQRALPIVENTFGTDNIVYAGMLRILALVFIATGDTETALKNLLPALEIAVGLVSRKITDYQLSMGELSLIIGSYHWAELMLKVALTFRSDALEYAELSGEPREKALFGMAPVQNILGALYTVTVLYDKAEPLLLDALSGYEATLGTEHPKLEGVLVNLAALYEALGQRVKAEEYQKRAERIHKKYIGFSHISMSSLPKPFELAVDSNHTVRFFVNARVGDWVVYEYPGTGMLSKKEIVRLTPVVAVIKTYIKRKNAEWGEGPDEIYKLGANIEAIYGYGVSESDLKIGSVRVADKDIASKILIVTEEGVTGKVYFASDVVPVGGLVKMEMGGEVLMKLVEYQYGKDITKDKIIDLRDGDVDEVDFYYLYIHNNADIGCVFFQIPKGEMV